jgi:hypothetical protein
MAVGMLEAVENSVVGAAGMAKEKKDDGIRARVENSLAKKLQDLGIIDDAEKAKKAASWAGVVADFLPVIGDVGGAVDTYDAAKKGDWADAAVNGALTLVGIIPGVGDAVAGAGKKAWNAVGDVTHRTPTKDVMDTTVDGARQSDKSKKRMLEGSIGSLREEMGLKGDYETIITNSHDLTGLPTLKASELEGGVYMPVKGDRTAVGMLEQMQGLRLDNPVDLQGGPTYPMESRAARGENAAGWESTEGTARGFQEKVQQVAEHAGTDKVFAMYQPMGLDSADFSTMLTDSALGEMHTLIARGAKYPKDMVKKVDDAVRGATAKGFDFTTFPGIESPEAREWLSRSGYQNARKAMTDVMEKAPFREAGFPRIHQIKRDVAQPGLLNHEIGQSGDMIFRADPNKSIDFDSSHRSYGTRIPIADGDNTIGRMNGSMSHAEAYPENYRRMEGQTDRAGKPLIEPLKKNVVSDSNPGGDRVDGYERFTAGMLESLIERGFILP